MGLSGEERGSTFNVSLVAWFLKRLRERESERESGPFSFATILPSALVVLLLLNDSLAAPHCSVSELFVRHSLHSLTLLSVSRRKNGMWIF